MADSVKVECDMNIKVANSITPLIKQGNTISTRKSDER